MLVPPLHSSLLLLLLPPTDRRTAGLYFAALGLGLDAPGQHAGRDHGDGLDARRGGVGDGAAQPVADRNVERGEGDAADGLRQRLGPEERALWKKTKKTEGENKTTTEKEEEFGAKDTE